MGSPGPCGGLIERIKPDPQKINKLEKLLPSKNILQLRAFLEFKWDEPQQKVFDWLKQCLTQSPILQYPDYFKPFILFTNASYQELGTVLLQIKNTIIWAIKYFYHYIYGTRFTLITDYKALQWLLNSYTINDNKRITRWRLILQEYQFDIKYRASS
ncbi:33015_t:CDS:2 [Gigaspora margarita]|uniref:33015_t:CDS:1 n=1 Tax=Gigaspora margarita TaxID=4874 RepID=A0ABN7WET7_GIGMA|nr:33015_t:CDS:2 [Gigaspora margarita]